MEHLARRVVIWPCVTAVIAATTATASDIDPVNKWTWAENAGWTNWQHDAPSPGDGVLVSQTYLAGFVWAENIGWISLDDAISFVAEVPCPGDVDCSTEVAFADLLTVIGNWGPCPGGCAADLDGDESVGFSDILVLIGNWGPCP